MIRHRTVPKPSRRGLATSSRIRWSTGNPSVVDTATFALHANFRKALREFLRFSERAAREAGLTPMQHQLLLAIAGSREGWLSVGDIARELMIQPHSAVGLVERAATRGLVQKEADPADHRRVRVRLQPRGKALIERLTRAHRRELRRLWDRIPGPR